MLGLQSLRGSAEIAIADLRQPVDVCLDIEAGYFIAIGLSDQVTTDLFTAASQRDQALLRRVLLHTPAGALLADELGPFQISFRERSPGPDSALEASTLGRIWSGNVPLDASQELVLRPLNSRMAMRLEDGETSGSELVLSCPGRSRFRINLEYPSIRLASCAEQGPFAEHLLLASPDPGLSQRLPALQVAISLLSRRKVVVRVAREGSEVVVNLARFTASSPLPPLVWPRHQSQVLNALLEHVDAGGAGDRPGRSLYYTLIEAMGNPAPLEVRVMNAFTHLEMIDGADTLSNGHLRGRFRLSDGDAKALREVRNAMVHGGLGIQDAMAKASQLIAASPGGDRHSRVLDECFKSQSPPGAFYCALIDLLSEELLERIGCSVDWLRRLGAVRFRPPE